jgi:hypothetical protein
MNLAEKQYWAGEFTDAELDAAADAGDRYPVQTPIENELFGLWSQPRGSSAGGEKV